MGKVFTITEGLENLGALKTGGQGSVYKAKRTGTIITAVKLLPTPIFNESLSDKNYTDFKNEVAKLKRVNEEPNPNVVKILSSGITETGSFPFIEMEFIEGPDLEELLKPPHDPVFTVKETIKVAEHLAHAIAHCHKAEVKHGDIKSNNVKLNIHSGNYVLLDFGLAVMNDEQRRTSLRQAGAIEFMAPEQANGDVFYQTDVYSFGVIIFELLAGVVPFPLQDKSETARNHTMVAHMETPPPDLRDLRGKNMAYGWSEAKKQHELNLPQWLIAMVYRCLEKKPEKRFENGQAMYEYILQHATMAETANAEHGELEKMRTEVQRLQRENEELRASVFQSVRQSDKNTALAKGNSRNIWLATGIIGALIAILILLIALKDNGSETTSENTTATAESNGPKQFKVVSRRAYFHNEPDAQTRRNAWLIPSDEIITAEKEANGFVYINFTNTEGQTSKGWVLKKDLKPLATDETETQRPLTMDEIRKQLKDARAHLDKGKTSEAVRIYGGLIDDNVPEAMYQYGNLALQGKNPDIDCPEAIKWLTRAVDLGYPPAKRTLAFLYLFGEDNDMIRGYHYQRCKFRENHSKGSKLMMDAALDGDTSAQRLLDLFRNR